MCNCQRTNFVYPGGRVKPQNRYSLCENSRDGLPCGRVQVTDSGTRYLPGAQPTRSPAMSPPLGSPTGDQLDPSDVLLPSLTDGPTASTVSVGKPVRSGRDPKKPIADGGIFSFGFFGRSKDKKKNKDKDEPKRKSKSKSSKSSSSETMVGRQRSSRKPNSTLPEAPEPPAPTGLFGEIKPTQYATQGGTTVYGVPPSSAQGVYNTPLSPSVHYPQTLDPRIIQRPTVYEERVPPSHRVSVPESSFSYIQTRQAEPSSEARRSSYKGERRSAPYRHSVYLDPEELLPSNRQPPLQPLDVPINDEADVPGEPQVGSDATRDQLREQARERQRQEQKIADLEEELKRAKDELARVQAREAEAAPNRQRQRQPRTTQPEPLRRPPSREQYESRATAAPYDAPPGPAPQRTFSQRATAPPPTRQERTRAATANTGRDALPERTRATYPPDPPLRRHATQRTAPDHDDPARQTRRSPSPSPPPPLRRTTDRPAPPPQAPGGTSRQVQTRIADLQADIEALRRARHTVEDDLVQRMEADARIDALERARELPRLRAYERLVGADREQVRPRRPPPHEGRSAAREAMRRSMVGVEELRRGSERRRSGLYEG